MRRGKKSIVHDVIIIGAGPAGLSAALLLARCRRMVFVFDSNEPRNAASHALHGFLTRDGVNPGELRSLGRADLARYPCVAFHEEAVVDVRKLEQGFEAVAEDGRTERSRLLLLATGRTDAVPNIPGFAEYYGRGVFRCPYCDGWEHRGQPLAVHGRSERAFQIARELLTWSDQVTLCCDGVPEWPGGRQRAREIGIRVDTRKVRRLEGNHAGLTHVIPETGEPISCGAIFFDGACNQRSPLPERLGCRLDHERAVHCDRHAATEVPGLYIAGNVRGGIHMAITAAAEGAEAAIEINEALLDRAYASTVA